VQTRWSRDVSANYVGRCVSGMRLSRTGGKPLVGTLIGSVSRSVVERVGKNVRKRVSTGAW
jgi:hypothetical protein